jgi:hypothetical protein
MKMAKRIGRKGRRGRPNLVPDWRKIAGGSGKVLIMIEAVFKTHDSRVRPRSSNRASIARMTQFHIEPDEVRLSGLQRGRQNGFAVCSVPISFS